MSINKKTIASMQSIALDSINRAGQGHIGMAIGAAPITYSLIGKELSFSSKTPKWINRDKFVLSAGHGSMSYYSIMHFLGLLSKSDMMNHKVLHSKTPSHPEVDAFEFVDASTGPLGQGVAMAVGMAFSQVYLEQRYNRKGFEIFDHHIFTLHGDGCLQEGIALEAIQIAGTYKLNKLIVIQDYNDVQIDSRASEVNNIDIIKFYESCGFNTWDIKEPTSENIERALKEARKSDKPAFIRVHTIIAQATPLENKSSGHNGVLSPEDTIAFKTKLGLKNMTPFEYDEDVYAHGQELMDKKNQKYLEWEQMFKKYEQSFPNEHKEIMDLINHKIKNSIMDVTFKETSVATRNYLSPIMASLEKQWNVLGGSADLASATKVKFDKGIIEGGKNIKYGIREFAMTAINNGIYLASNLRTIDSTFLAFADYSKAAYRLGAIMNIPSIHVMTHDSYQVGGDGPTHQPFDQIPMLRAMTGTNVIRIADESEMKLAVQYALDADKEQTFIIACRQPIKSFNLLKDVKKLPAAYKVWGSDKQSLSLLGSGSEVELLVEVAKLLQEQYKISAQVISVPSLQKLIEDENLIKTLNLHKHPMFAVEATSDSMWYRLAKYNKFDAFLAHGYGWSTDGQEVYELKGFEKNKLAKLISNFYNK